MHQVDLERARALSLLLIPMWRLLLVFMGISNCSIYAQLHEELFQNTFIAKIVSTCMRNSRGPTAVLRGIPLHLSSIHRLRYKQVMV